MICAAKKAFENCKEAEGHKMMEGRIATGDQFISEKTVSPDDDYVRDTAISVPVSRSYYKQLKELIAPEKIERSAKA